jgi:hypothetical protein
MKLNEDDRYECSEWPGVAVRFDGLDQRFERYVSVDDETGEEFESWDGEWVDDPDSPFVFVVMVGDDKRHRVRRDELRRLDELDYCAECGQVGCTHDGRSR